MATLSRWMPPQPQPATGPVAYAPLGVLGAGLLAAAIFSLTGRVIVIGLTLLIVLGLGSAAPTLARPCSRGRESLYLRSRI